MKQLLGIVVLSALGLAMSACAGQAAEPQDPAAEKSADALTITEETATTLKGSFVRGDSLVTFSSKLEGTVFTNALVVNGAPFDFRYDLAGFSLDVDGHSNTLLVADGQVLASFEKALDDLGKPNVMREGLFKSVSMMAQAPRGTTLITRQIKAQGANAAAEVPHNYCVSNEGITWLPGGCGAPGAGNNLVNTGSCYYLVNNTAGDPANVPVNTHEHEQCEASASCNSSGDAGQHGFGTSSCFWSGKYHGRVYWNDHVGYASKACEGRCGAGCPVSYNYYYSKDCFDHDVCLDNHPAASSNSTLGDCGNEWDEASDDFSFGTSSSYQSYCGAAGVMNECSGHR